MKIKNEKYLLFTLLFFENMEKYIIDIYLYMYRCVCICMTLGIEEMDSTIKILNEITCISLHANALGNSMEPFIHPAVNGK